MYKITMAVLLALFLSSCGSGGDPIVPPNPNPIDTSALDNLEPPIPTATTEKGKPATSFVATAVPLIGADGGQITSQDGLATLVVPAGAVSDFAIFSIQQVSNQMPTGLGLAYRVKAKKNDGSDQDVMLTKPLELRIDVLEKQLNATAPDDITLAFQGTDGKWLLSTQATRLLRQAEGDIQVKGAVNQSGDYAVAARYKLYPAKSIVKVNASLVLTALKTVSNPQPSIPSYAAFDITRVPAQNWAVNGVAGGNNSVGILIGQSDEGQKSYKAPKTKPSPNPASVTAQVMDGARTVNIKSSVRVEDSKGWIEIFGDVSHYQRWNEPSRKGALRIEGSTNYALDVTESTVASPQTVAGTQISGFANYKLKLRKGGMAALIINYRLAEELPCVCTPNTGTIKRTTTYDFSGANEPYIELAAIDSDGFANGEIDPNGMYQLNTVADVALDGNYTFTFSESYPCGDRPARPARNESGSDTIKFVGGQLKLEGSVKPQGPDRMKGVSSLAVRVELPRKALAFGTVFGSFGPTWFLPYEPSLNPQAVPRILPPLPSYSPALPQNLEPRGVLRPQC